MEKKESDYTEMAVQLALRIPEAERIKKAFIKLFKNEFSLNLSIFQISH